MKRAWPQLRLLLLGAVPLLPGCALEKWGRFIAGDRSLAGVLVGVGVLVFFYVAAQRAARRGEKGFRPLALLNGFGLLMLVLVCVQLVGAGDYWPNLAGDLSRWFFLPVMGISSNLLMRGASYGWMAPMAAWFLQALLSAIGSNVRLLRK